MDGTIVVAPRDILLPQKMYVSTPITCKIEKGWITDIRGGLDAKLVKSYTNAFNDPRRIGVSQVSRGMEPRAFDGNLMFSTGPNNELGGPNDTACHLDIPMRNCSLSYHDLEEILAERGVGVDHATLNRRVVKCAPQIAARAQARKRPTARSWRMNETYIKVKRPWMDIWRAVDRDGQTLDFMLSERRDLATA